MAVRIEETTFTTQQWALLRKYYGAEPQDNALAQGRSELSVSRSINADGRALLQFLAPYLRKGETPVQLVQKLAIDAGWDVPGIDEEEG